MANFKSIFLKRKISRLYTTFTYPALAFFVGLSIKERRGRRQHEKKKASYICAANKIKKKNVK
jgi:hypothetical protein